MLTFSYLAPAVEALPPSWQRCLFSEALLPQLLAIDQALFHRAKAGAVIYPAAHLIFHALQFCEPEQIKVVILGQDPYHGENEAMGLAFSVRETVKMPPSLKNIFKELTTDCAKNILPHGDLTCWAKQGVLLLNSVLTVEKNNAGSHARLGWQNISDILIHLISQKKSTCVFMLWGQWAQSKMNIIHSQRHLILCAPHPSPFSAHRGFFGCRHFSQANDWLIQHGEKQINW